MNAASAVQVQQKQHQHSSMHSQYQQPVTAASAAWQQSVLSVNHAGDTGTANCATQYRDFASQHHDVMDTTQLLLDHNMKSKQQLTSGFGQPSSMQHGFAGGRPPPSGIVVSQNNCVAQVCETNALDVNQSVHTGADRQQMLQYNMCQQRDILVDRHQTVRRPRHFITPGQHSMSVNGQPTTTRDVFTSYHNQSMIQPHHQSFTVQQQQPWTSSHSYSRTGYYASLTLHYLEFKFRQTTYLDLLA